MKSLSQIQKRRPNDAEKSRMIRKKEIKKNTRK